MMEMIRIGYQDRILSHEPVLVGMIPWVRWFLWASYLPKIHETNGQLGS